MNYKKRRQKKKHTLLIGFVAFLFTFSLIYYIVFHEKWNNTSPHAISDLTSERESNEETTSEGVSYWKAPHYQPTSPITEVSSDSYWNSASSAPHTTESDTKKASSNNAPSQEEFYAILENTVTNRAETVRFSNCDYRVEWVDFYAMPYGTFWLQDFSYCTYTGNGVNDVEYRFEYYPLSDNELETMKEDMAKQIKFITSLLPDDSSTYEKALIVHDAIARMVSYDQSQSLPHTHDAYSALVLGYGVCTAYASAYSIIMQSVGIPCQIVNTSTHAYNKIGQTYIDVCWDDVDPTEQLENGYITHLYFGMDYETINSVKDHEINHCTPPFGCYDYLVPYYYVAEEYTLSDYNLNQAVEIMRSQLNNNTNILTVTFDNYDAYAKGKEDLTNETWTIVDSIGYTGEHVYYFYDDDSLTWSLIVP